MTLIETIKVDQLAARKALIANKSDVVLNVKAPLLTTLIGEAEAVGKNAGRAPTDEEVVATVKKFVKGAEETIRALNAAEKVDSKGYETLGEANMTVDILSAYLPKQMTAEEIEAFFDLCKSSGATTTAAGMANLKAACAGAYDGKLAAMIAKRYF